MSGFRLLPQAEAELDDIWLYIAREGGSVEAAGRVIDVITERFWLIAQHPQIGRRRDHELGPELRSFPAGEYVIIYRIEGDEILILHVRRGSRDIPELLED